MISVDDTYPGRVIPPNADYPEGSIKNETVPNSSDDGTPADRLWPNDFEGLKQAISRSCGIVPTAPGNIPDTALSSQMLQGLIELIQGRALTYDETGVTDALVLTPQANQQAPASLFDGQEFSFTSTTTTTGIATVDLVGLGIKTISNSNTVGIIKTGDRVKIRYKLASDDVEVTLSKSTFYGAVAYLTVDNSLNPTPLTILDGVSENPQSDYDVATGLYTASKEGLYKVYARGVVTEDTAASSIIGVEFRLNGGTNILNFTKTLGTAEKDTEHQFSGQTYIRLALSDTINARYVSLGSSTASLSGSLALNMLLVEWIAD